MSSTKLKMKFSDIGVDFNRIVRRTEDNMALYGTLPSSIKREETEQVVKKILDVLEKKTDTDFSPLVRKNDGKNLPILDDEHTDGAILEGNLKTSLLGNLAELPWESGFNRLLVEIAIDRTFRDVDLRKHRFKS